MKYCLSSVCFPFPISRGDTTAERLEDFDPAGTGQHNGITHRGKTTGNQTGGNNEKMRNVTFIVGKQEKAACATHWNFKIVHVRSIIVRYFQNGFLSINYVHNQFQNIQWFIFKVLQKNQKCVCQNMPKKEIYIHKLCP